MDPLRIAIVGPGFIGRVHARAIREVPGAELVGVVASAGRPTTADEFAGVARYADATALAASSDVDAVIVATPNDSHAALASTLLDAGKHVLLEKPMARNLADAQSLMERARASDAQLAIGHMWRFDPEVRLVRSWVESGALGQIVRTKGCACHVGWGPGGWFTDPARAGGGALLDMGVHAIDTVRFLLGDPGPLEVHARMATHYGSYPVEDTVLLSIRWADGCDSQIEAGWWQPHADGPEASTQLFGSTGFARLFPTELQIREGERQHKQPLELAPRSEHCPVSLYAAQLEAFCAAIGGDADAIPDPAHGLTVMRICEAAYCSARENRIVSVEEVSP